LFSKILDRSIARETSSPALIALVVFSFLFLINLLFQLANLVLQDGLQLGAALLLFVYSLPTLLAYTLPVAVLAGTIIAFGRLSADSEIIALRAAGLPVRHLLRAPLAIGVLVGTLLLSLNLWVIPAARTGQQRLMEQATRLGNLVKMVKPRVFYDRIPGVLLYVDAEDAPGDRYLRVLIFQHSGPGKDMLTSAQWARLVESPDAGSLQFLLGPGETALFDQAHPEKVQLSDFTEQALTVIPAKSSAEGRAKDLQSLTLSELLGRIASPASESVSPTRRSAWRYELHRRFASALAVLLFALLAVPLGMGNTRGGKGAAFSLSLGGVLFYWVVYSTLEDLAIKGRFSPVAAAWIPCAALLGVGLFFLRRRGDKPAEPFRRSLPAWLPFRKSRASASFGQASQPSHAEGWLSVVDRYLLSHVARYFFLIAAAVLLLDVIIEMRGFSEYLTGPAQWGHFARYLGGQLITLGLLILPLTLLMTVLVVLGVLEKGNELTALKAGGVSLYRISFTFLTLGVVAGAASWVLSEGVVPTARRTAQIHKQALKHYVSTDMNVTYDVWLFTPDRGTLFHYDHYDAASQTFEGFSQYTLGAGGDSIASRFFAQRARFDGPRSLSFTGGWRWSPSASPRFRTEAAGRVEMPAGREYFVLPPFLEGAALSSGELSRIIRDLEAKGRPTSRQRMDYQRKFAEAATPLALLLTGLPFAFRVGKRGSLYGVAIAVGLSIAFYVVQALFAAIGEMEWLDPTLAAWAPAVLFSLTGGYGVLSQRS